MTCEKLGPVVRRFLYVYICIYAYVYIDICIGLGFEIYGSGLWNYSLLRARGPIPHVGVLRRF